MVVGLVTCTNPYAPHIKDFNKIKSTIEAAKNIKEAQDYQDGTGISVGGFLNFVGPFKYVFLYIIYYVITIFVLDLARYDLVFSGVRGNWDGRSICFQRRTSLWGWAF